MPSGAREEAAFDAAVLRLLSFWILPRTIVFHSGGFVHITFVSGMEFCCSSQRKELRQVPVAQ